MNAPDTGVGAGHAVDGRVGRDPLDQARLRQLAEEQAALRRVATLVARTISPEAVFAAVGEEVGGLLPIDMAVMARYEPGRKATSRVRLLCPGERPPGRVCPGYRNALWHKHFDNRWSDWDSLGGKFTSSPPSAVSWGEGRLDVFAQDTDDTLQHKSYENEKWSEWEPLGVVVTSAPVAMSWAAGRLEVVARGSDNGLGHLSWAGTSSPE